MRRRDAFMAAPARRLAAILLLLIVARHAAAAGDAAGVAAGESAPQAPVVQSFGEGSQTLYLVDHGDTWSMHAEELPAEAIFKGWQEAGGPEIVSKVVLDFPFTLSMHRVTTERIVGRILEGYGYTLHYDARGRLERVRVYSPQPARMFKTPRLVESLGSWRQVETPAPAADGGAAGMPDEAGSVEMPAGIDSDDQAPPEP